MSWMNKLKLAVDNSDKLKEAVEKSRQALGENADKINSVIDSVTSTADSKTGGKYADKLEKLKDTAKGGVDQLAGEETPTGASPATPTAPAAPSAAPAPGATAPGLSTPEPDPPDAEVVDG